MNRKSKKRLRGIISTILSFLLAVLFTVGSVLVGLYIGFLNENRIIAKAQNQKSWSSHSFLKFRFVVFFLLTNHTIQQHKKH